MESWFDPPMSVGCQSVSIYKGLVQARTRAPGKPSAAHKELCRNSSSSCDLVKSFPHNYLHRGKMKGCDWSWRNSDGEDPGTRGALWNNIQYRRVWDANAVTRIKDDSWATELSVCFVLHTYSRSCSKKIFPLSVWKFVIGYNVGLFNNKNPPNSANSESKQILLTNSSSYVLPKHIA